MVFLMAVICPFDSLVILFTLLLNLANHICLDGGSAEFQDAFVIR